MSPTVGSHARVAQGRGPAALWHNELSALFERESAPVAQWIRAADFGLSGRQRCSPSVSGGAKRVELSALFSAARGVWDFHAPLPDLVVLFGQFACWSRGREPSGVRIRAGRRTESKKETSCLAMGSGASTGAKWPRPGSWRTWGFATDWAMCCVESANNEPSNVCSPRSSRTGAVTCLSTSGSVDQGPS